MLTVTVESAPVGAPLIVLLEQISSVVQRLTDEQYARKPVGTVEGSIGGHVRHCLDHVTALLNAIDSGLLDYDTRQRGTDIENSALAALDRIDQLSAALGELSPEAMERCIEARMLLAADDAPVTVATSIGRELAYVLSHTIHHNALIGAMVRTLGGTLPERFGYAPSTIAYTNPRTCAQ